MFTYVLAGMHLCVVFSSAFIGISPQLISIPAIESKPHSLPLRIAVSCHIVPSDPYSSAINSLLSSSHTTAQAQLALTFLLHLCFFTLSILLRSRIFKSRVFSVPVQRIPSSTQARPCMQCQPLPGRCRLAAQRHDETPQLSIRAAWRWGQREYRGNRGKTANGDKSHGNPTGMRTIIATSQLV